MGVLGVSDKSTKKGITVLLQEATSLTIQYLDFKESDATDKEKLTLADEVIKRLSELCSMQHEYLTEINKLNDAAYISSLKPTPKQ